MENNHAREMNKESKKKSWYRMLWPEFADFTPKTNRFVHRDPTTNYNTKTGAFPTLNHDYADHQA
jgi:hypothetical protein